jgi:hypothetical protein
MASNPHLLELLRRLGARRGAAALISEEELASWADATMRAMKAHGLLSKASPAVSTVCPGCERECVMPVQIQRAVPHHSQAFIVCDKRTDINRVMVSTDRLAQWQVSAGSIADLISHQLGLRRPPDNPASARWGLGVFKGKKHSSHLLLRADGELTLSLAGHSISLADILDLSGDQFVVDKGRLIRLVDHPAAGGGDVESARERQKRLMNRVLAERAEGTKGFLKVVAEEEGISTSRLKQIIYPESPPPADRSGASSRAKRPGSTRKKT